MAIPAGILLAALFSQFDIVVKAMQPVVIWLVITPMITLIPLMTLWLGTDPNLRVIIVIIQATPIICMNTLNGFIHVEQEKLELAKSIGATKLQEEDAVVSVQVVTENQHAVLQTKGGYFLRFPASEIPEKKKGAVGVRGMKLQKKDELELVYLFEEGTEAKGKFGEKEIMLNRLKVAKRDSTGTKSRG